MNTSLPESRDGVLLIDKPAGITSHDVVYRLRRALNISRIGHAGTLDPLATGLLIMLIGKATKYSQFLVGMDKCYSGSMKLGEITDSYDSDGTITEIRPLGTHTLEDLQILADSFLGPNVQIPPMFSAKKLNGQPLYKLARKGRVVERASIEIRISQFKIDQLRTNIVDFFVHCSSGTYVRSLVHDFGQKLGCGAHLCALRRTKIGDFDVSDALPLDQICALPPADICARLIDPSSLITSNRPN